jgi:CRP/FNR family cyclic AMP-dependent transcriptional regulator
MAKVENPTDGKSFSFLPPELATALVAKALPVKLAPDQVLFNAGDPGNGCYWINDGLLKVTVDSASGGQRILAILGPGTLVGEAAILDAAPRSASVYAVRESRLAHVSRTAFDSFAFNHPEVYRYITILLMRRLRDIDDAVAATSFLPLKGRVARALLSLADAFGKDVGSGRILVQQKINQTDLAAMAGIARENVNRILRDWIRDGAISRLAGYYCLEKKKDLEKELTA